MPDSPGVCTRLMVYKSSGHTKFSCNRIVKGRGDMSEADLVQVMAGLGAATEKYHGSAHATFLSLIHNSGYGDSFRLAAF